MSLVALTQTGCASKPTMHLKHAEVSGMRIAFPPSVGVVMTSVVDVYNPNSYDVAIRAMRGQVIIADRYTLPIDFRPTGDGLWLASSATTTVRVPVTVPMDLALQLLRETYTSPVVTFRVMGSADVTATRTFKLEKDDYSVDERGTFTRQQLELALQMFPNTNPTSTVVPGNRVGGY
ncbi:LEA type 2 family protein [Labilithrix luteola]|nr:LEA type 2 family protein [Labilithrix luteola]